MLRKLVALVDPSGRPGRATPRPGARDDMTDPWVSPWDVRTLIAAVPGGGPVRFVFLNVILGRIAIAGFDDPRRASDACAVLVLDGAGAHSTRRLDFGREGIRAEEGLLALEGPDGRYRLEGRWPEYRATLDGAAGASFDLELRCRGPLHEWAAALPLYSHWSAFGEARGRVAIGEARGEIARGGASLEHGRGRNLEVLTGWPRVPARAFHYEVGRLASGDQWAIVSFRFAAGLEAIRRGAYQRADGSVVALADYSLETLETARTAAREGPPLDVPRRWRIAARSADRAFTLAYEAQALAPPFVGAGRVSSTPVRAAVEVRDGAARARGESVGYLEFMTR